MLPGKGSVAIDRIPPGANCGPGVLATDQRGAERPAHVNCDVGAVEVPYRVPPRVVSQ